MSMNLSWWPSRVVVAGQVWADTSTITVVAWGWGSEHAKQRALRKLAMLRFETWLWGMR